MRAVKAPLWRAISSLLPALVCMTLSGSSLPSALAVNEGGSAPTPTPPLIQTAKSGLWSEAATWQGGKVPAGGAKVRIGTGHRVVYDMQSDHAIRSIHIAGILSFAWDRDTRLDVGLIKIQPGGDTSEEGFDCDAHVQEPDRDRPRPALEVGTPEQPISPEHSATIRLVYFAGMDKDSCPAIVCCGGRMDFHGAPLSRTWVKLGATAHKGDTVVTLAEPVQGWRSGDRVLLTATRLSRDDGRGRHGTEERSIRSLEAGKITLDRPLDEEHGGEATTAVKWRT